jgi:DinB superfamily
MSKGVREFDSESQAKRLERAAEQLTELLRRPESARSLRTAPGANQWSAMQIVGHTVEIIPYWMRHCEAIVVAGGSPHTFGRAHDAPERVAGIERFASGDRAEALQALNDVVRAAAAAIRRMPEADRRRRGIYAKGGECTVAGIIERFVVAHAEEHVAQARDALRA